MLKQRTKVIRKVSLLKKIKNYPYDLVLALNEYFQLIDWDEIATENSFVATLVCNLLLLLTKAYIAKNSIQEYKTLKIKKSMGTVATICLATAKFIYYFLNVTSFVNFFLCATSYKSYDLITRDIENVPRTTSAFKAELSVPVVEAEEGDHDSHFIMRLMKFMALKVYHRMFPKKKSMASDQDNKKLVWRLLVWNPTILQLHILALFSPLNALFVYLISPITVGSIIFLIILTAYQYYLIFFKYETKLKDEFIINKSLLHEYDTKYVNPRLNKRYIDKNTDPNGTVTAFYHNHRTKQFVTHGL